MPITAPYDDNNIFAAILRGDSPCVRIYEDRAVLAFMDIFPESTGHVLVIPKYPARNLFDLPLDVIGPYMERVQMIATAIHKALQPNGIKIMQYNGSEASQSVFHVHVHIVPCYTGQALTEHGTVPTDIAELQSVADRITAQLDLR